MIYSLWPLFVTTVLYANMAILCFTDCLGIAIVSTSILRQALVKENPPDP